MEGSTVVMTKQLLNSMWRYRYCVTDTLNSIRFLLCTTLNSMLQERIFAEIKSRAESVNSERVCAIEETCLRKRVGIFSDQSKLQNSLRNLGSLHEE